MDFASLNKDNFTAWLGKQKIKIPVATYIEKFEEVSRYAQTHGVCKDDFWMIDDPKKFNFIRSKLSGDKLFKNTKKNLFDFFERFSRQYSVYLKKEPSLDIPENDPSDSPDSLESEEQRDEIEIGKMQDGEEGLVGETEKTESVYAFDDANIPQPDVFESAMLIDGFLRIRDGRASRESEAFELSIKLRYLALNCGKSFESVGRSAEEICVLLSCVEDILENGESSECRFDILQRTAKIYIGDEDTFYNVLKEANLRYNDESGRYKLYDLLRDIIVSDEFYGVFRLNSYRHMAKLRNIAKERGVDLTNCSDEGICDILERIGFINEDMLYVYDHVAIYECVAKIKKIFGEGYCVIYLAKYFDDNFEWFTSRNIQSWGALKEILSNGVNNICFGRGGGFATLNKKIPEIDAVANELLDKWGENVVHSYRELFELLPYIPEDKIKLVLSQRHEFVYSSSEVFAKTDLVSVTDDEVNAIYDYVSERCNQTGYASIWDIPCLKDILDENYDVSDLAVCDAIYYRFLSGDFVRDNLGILSRRSRDIETSTNDKDLFNLLTEYCKDKDMVTFSELDERTRSLIKGSYKQKTLSAAYDVMIRKDKSTFVSNDFVHFDVVEIDKALDDQILGDFISIKGVVSFLLFPDCGIPWNHYVLESYCYRFSKKFRLEKISFNDKNVGIIVRGMCGLNYYEILAEVLAKSDVELSPDEAGRFLVENGYASKAKFSMMDEVLQMANEIRERK